MKYCIDYNKKSKILDKVDEINIVYNLKDTTLLEFLLTNKEKRVNICIEDLDIEKQLTAIEKIKDIKNSNENLQLFIRLQNINDDLIKKIKEYNLPFYINLRVNNWDTFRGLIDLGVSDIYITEDLCFNLLSVSSIAHSNGVQLRTFPNVAQSQWNSMESLKKFFIRPEDIDTYSMYIDVVEFFGDIDKTEVLYKIYAIDKKWMGRLDEIIIGFDGDLDSRFILPKFASYRTNCRKKCLKGGSCHICEAIEELSKTLADKGFMFTIKKESAELKEEEEFKTEIIDLIEKI